MRLHRFSASCAAAALGCSSAVAQNGCTDSLLWDNGPPDGTGGYSNIIGTCGVGIDRTLLDDFSVADPGWDVSCFEWHHIWANGAGAGFGTGAVFTLRADAGAMPGPVIQPLNITSYSDMETGNVYFSRPEVISTVEFDRYNLEPGKYWFEAAICGSDNNFWLMHDPILCSESWLNYPDLGWYGPGSDFFGEQNDMSWRLFGTERDDPIVMYCNSTDGHPNNTSGIDISGNVLGQGIEVCLTGGPPNQFGYLLIGDGNGIVNQPPGAKGDLCVVGGICLGRYAKDIGLIDAAGSLCTDLQNSASGGPNYGIPTCGGNIQPGQTWYFQYWHRQPQGQPSTFSEAACVIFNP